MAKTSPFLFKEKCLIEKNMREKKRTSKEKGYYCSLKLFLRFVFFFMFLLSICCGG